MEIPKVKLHPMSVKLLGQGHFWVTKDSFTQNFPNEETKFLSADLDKNRIAILLNDPKHPQIKARLWSLSNSAPFKTELEKRLIQSIEKRKHLNLKDVRENFYLCFGESDDLPGLFILALSNVILIQSYMPFWETEKEQLIKLLQKHYKGFQSLYWQDRGINDKKPATLLWGESHDSFVVKEFGINYQIKLAQGYDHGLYTDMASFRNKFAKSFQNRAVLNLFSYTGAYSLFALKHGAKSVTSVDLSKPYLDWLNQNLDLNPDLNKESHCTLEMSTERALKELRLKKSQFDFIICDPPSSSSDGQKRVNALDEYQNLLPIFSELMAPKALCLIFLNTHKTSFQTFATKIQSIIKDKQLKFSLELNQKLKLDEDCGIRKGFLESDYLKALVLKKI
jgi:23S rRNA (cytosine1962-C5)-methyltransferase